MARVKGRGDGTVSRSFMYTRAAEAVVSTSPIERETTVALGSSSKAARSIAAKLSVPARVCSAN